MAKVPGTPGRLPTPAPSEIEQQADTGTVEVSAPVEITYRPRGFGVSDVETGGKRMNFLVTPYQVIGIELVDDAIDGLIAALRPEPESALWTPPAPGIVAP